MTLSFTVDDAIKRRDYLIRKSEQDEIDYIEDNFQLLVTTLKNIISANIKSILHDSWTARIQGISDKALDQHERLQSIFSDFTLRRFNQSGDYYYLIKLVNRDLETNTTRIGIIQDVRGQYDNHDSINLFIYVLFDNSLGFGSRVIGVKYLYNNGVWEFSKVNPKDKFSEEHAFNMDHYLVRSFSTAKGEGLKDIQKIEGKRIECVFVDDHITEYKILD